MQDKITCGEQESYTTDHDAEMQLLRRITESSGDLFVVSAVV